MFTLFNKICDKLGISLNFSNRDSSSSNKASVKNSSLVSIQQATGDIHNMNITNHTQPRIDIAEYAGIGGADGTFVIFKIKNDGGEVAIDIQGELTADNIQIGNIFNTIHNLSSGQTSQSIRYPYHNTEFFTRQLVNPRIVFRYKAADGRSFANGRTIVQELREDGMYNIHTRLGSYFEESVSN